jgi:hypothetical protein
VNIVKDAAGKALGSGKLPAILKKSEARSQKSEYAHPICQHLDNVEAPLFDAVFNPRQGTPVFGYSSITNSVVVMAFE